MKKLMELKEVIDLIKEIIETHKENVQETEDYLAHSKESYKITEEIVEKILFYYPFLKERLNKREIALAAGLHDIGRPLKKDQLFHELRSARYIEEEGLKKGVANNLKDVYRIAQMIRPHGFVFEQFSMASEKEKFEFKDLDTALLIPRTWQESIVLYSDMANRNGKRMFIKERLNEITKRYSLDGHWRTYNPSLQNAVEKAKKRIYEVCDRVEKLSQGKIKKEKIFIYGFI